MKVLIIFVAIFVHITNSQIHYVPVNIHIPTLNATTIQNLHNSTVNKTHIGNFTGWNNPLLNKTSSWSWNQTTINGDLIIGQIGSMDHRLFNQVYRKEARWWTTRQTIVRYPYDLPGSYGRHETISAIRAYNKFQNGFDSFAEVLSGGIGKRFVKIRLRSMWSKGFRYLVQIYGH